MITCLIFSFSINYLWGDYKLEEVYYRPHEKYTKNNNYKKNISDTMYMPYGDLYALGKESKNNKNFEEIIEPRNIQFITDKYGYRNTKNIYEAEIILVGDSFIVGNGTTQNDIPSTQLQKLTNLMVANIAFPGSPQSYEKKLIHFLKNKKKKQKIYVFYFEGNDFDFNDYPKNEYFLKNLREYIDIDLDRYKDNYLSFIYPSNYSFFRIIRRKINILTNILKSKIKNENNELNNDDKIIIKEINKKYVGFYKNYIQISESNNIQTYIFNNKEVLRNIDAVFFIPTKYRVYNSKINYSENKTNLPLKILKKGYKNNNIPVYDLTNILVKESNKSNNLVYWRDDTHWNKLGIFVAMKYVAKKIVKN